jgi:hypothetical protein
VAKGNIGNLLQHFIAIRAAEQVVRTWDRPESLIEYIDCYSMAPWESITGCQPQGFVGRVNTFPTKAAKGDLVASTFLRAWQERYAPAEPPAHPQGRKYPSTAVLLRTGFPNQHWRMRLHEDDSTEAGKRERLKKWANEQGNGEYHVRSDWSNSDLICHSPAPMNRPVIIMLDPFRIVPNARADKGGYLSRQLLKFLCGSLALNLNVRNEYSNPAPLVITLFSYTDDDPDVADRIVRQQFKDAVWSVDLVRFGPFQGIDRQRYHQGWIVSSGIETPLLEPTVQEAWNAWNQ